MILAAGAGTRMRSATPKVLHRIAGRTLLHHALVAAHELQPARTVVVVRHEREAVAAHVAEVAPHALIADQDDVPGTGRAVACGMSVLDATTVAAAVAGGQVGDRSVLDLQIEGAVVVTSGDVPLVTGELLGRLVDAHTEIGNAVTILTAKVPDPTGYGRIVRGTTGDVMAIVEHRDATDEQHRIDEINSGIYVFDAAVLRDALAQVGRDNSQGEMYLTDVVALAREAGGRVGAMIAPDASAVEGVNDRVQLANAGAQLNRRIVEAWMRAGVTVVDPATTWIDADVTLGEDATILQGVQLHGSTRIGSGATVGPDSTLTNVAVGDGATVTRVHGLDAVVGDRATIGPFTYLRPGTIVGVKGKVGGFVETKNARIGDGAKVPHLSYVGDAEIGEGTNVGAGTIFVNYDGVHKHRTVVGAHVRIGSDNTLIAPVTLGDGAYTGAGTTVRHDVPPGALAINSSPQQNVDGWVERRRPGTQSAEAAERARRAPGSHEGLSSGGQGPTHEGES
ncbi:bifunctional UDP-N-acetylglucosamine diphosphorylase/glucosamine-1-phosphate N-acetyltransferase GlmU [Demequina capsici]|uniref:Bifunctional protein GlmU n=2 Tax=Demequina capsici TaxID=3075620 RepID=A0AA96FDV4_9MICO|nr:MULTISPECIES: bifunctional UDP-N-acetylglucosamine diphosphorylase/glucosamine-1-phosphate N-acetyltransferase GlmU [unclassified Demequina]WNM26022.1 bifunctional UDP-N-acetylglucosamine diphosphorylase/glucosamine-1-phosphate N-acetyltransferase GlmU [Demequina sp. OYTSA14]WNM28896.1 bifunctional UDP-N-acetylglucosamine diphosphorylase/glucosamine-1-phosphate N-acetyltransferase GlmU [Demequina sp. PMTSA13]